MEAKELRLHDMRNFLMRLEGILLQLTDEVIKQQRKIDAALEE